MKVQSTEYRVRGQALVIVLLSLAVVLTLVLFILARSTTDIAISSRSEESVRAFSAAEAGIEKALVIGAGGSGSFANSSYVSNVTSFAEAQNQFNYPIELASGDSMIVWFADHDENGGLGEKYFTGDGMTVCWGESGTALDQDAPAIEVSIFYEATPGLKGTTQIARAAFDPFSSRDPQNNFSQAGGAGCLIDGVSYAFQGTLDFAALGVNPAGLLFGKIRFFYNTDLSPVGISVSGGTLPSQGQDISSTGTAGDSNRKVRVFQGWPELPSVFDYAVYSSTGLTK